MGQLFAMDQVGCQAHHGDHGAAKGSVQERKKGKGGKGEELRRRKKRLEIGLILFCHLAPHSTIAPYSP
jgi:hypothetical protein